MRKKNSNLLFLRKATIEKKTFEEEKKTSLTIRFCDTTIEISFNLSLAEIELKLVSSHELTAPKLNLDHQWQETNEA